VFTSLLINLRGYFSVLILSYFFPAVSIPLPLPNWIVARAFLLLSYLFGECRGVLIWNIRYI